METMSERLDAVRLCRLDEIPDEGARRFKVPGLEPVAVVRHRGAVYALSDMCTHGLASLSEGDVEDGRIYCPYHSGAFDLATGAAVEKPCTIAVKTYAVRVIDGAVQLDLTDGGGR